jgi:uncharacterized protein
VAHDFVDVAAALALLARRVARGVGEGVSVTAPCSVIVMAKAPVAGYAKTRLIPALGAEGAARLAHQLLDHAITQAQAAALGMVELCCAPDQHHAAFASLFAKPSLAWADQGDGDLGQRMASAFARRLGPGERALMIGTDAPALNATMLQQAATALDEFDAVFVPALDGGYALIGLRQNAPALFERMTWSVPSVMQETRLRLAAEGLSWFELPPVADIDEPADLVHVPQAWLR